jgi:hypothetical protein
MIMNCEHVRMWKLLIVAYINVGPITMGAARISFQGVIPRKFAYKLKLKSLKLALEYTDSRRIGFILSVAGVNICYIPFFFHF